MVAQQFKALTALTICGILIVALKSQSLLLYWQQTHHQFMRVGELPTLTLSDWPQIKRWQQQWESIQLTGHYRMTLAGQILLLGDAALPKPLVQEIPTCPKPDPVATPSCPDLSSLTQAAPLPVPVTPVNTTDSPDMTADNNIPSLTDTPTVADSPEKNPEEISEAMLADAKGPINLNANDKVLLIGDSLMQGLAPHLNTLLKRHYKVITMDLSRHSTGLTYPAFFDWPATVKAAFELEHYACVIVFLGANDPWDIPTKGHYIHFGSKEWKAIYHERVASIINTANTHHARILWLGAPPMGREDLVKKIPVLNEIYAEEAAKVPLTARYLATASTITENGVDFSKFLTIPERGSVMIRADDGVHFTTQGQRLLATFTLTQFTSPTNKVSKL